MKTIKKEVIIDITKFIIELAVLILLVLLIIYIVNSKEGIISQKKQADATEKLDRAIKIFSSTDGMKLEESIKTIEGLNNLEINKETGEYKITIDNQEFLVISKEIIPEEDQDEK